MSALGGMIEQRIKQIAIGLAGLSLVLLIVMFVNVGRYNSLDRDYKELEKQRTMLRQENSVLTKKLSEIQNEITKVKQDADAMKAAMDKATADRDGLQAKLTALTTERDGLMAKLQEALASGPVQYVSKNEGAASQTTDEYWAGVLREKSDLEVQLLSLKSSLRDNQIKIDEVAKDKISLELDLQKLNREREDLQRRLDYNESSLANLSMQLYKEKQDRSKLQAQLSDYKQENYSLRTRLKQFMDSKINLEKKLKEADDRRAELSGRLNQMGTVLEDRVASMYEKKEEALSSAMGASSNVELSPIVVRSQGQEKAFAPPEGLYSGKVININASNNFVIVDIGENQGIEKGASLHVWRGGEDIATLEVIQTRANVSAADIKQKSQAIRAGDIVR